MGYFETVEDNWKIFKVDDDYRFVLAVVLGQVLVYFFCVGYAGSPRSKLFTQEFMDENFKAEHETSGLTDPLKKGGYPDVGSGRYTMATGYKGWYDFNIAQRVHIQYMEAITQMLFQQLFAGLYWPVPTAIIGIIYFIGRIVYTAGYIKGGPKGRLLGALMTLPIQMMMPIYTIVSLGYLASNKNT